MYILRSFLFITLALSTLIYVTHWLLEWSWMQVVGLLALGAIFIGASIRGYYQMYREDE